MIFTTDLDRTLIYSNRVLSEYPSNIDYTVVEAVDGRNISFTSTAFFKWLINRDIDSKLRIIANTARSKQEFERTSIHKYFDYGIVANGGIITYKGSILKDWELQIDRAYIVNLISEVLNKLGNFKSIEYESRLIDNSYIFTKTTDGDSCTQELNQLIQEYKDIRFIIQRNKVYIIPNLVSKANAIRWLSNYLSEEVAIASGDSEPDIEMLKLAKVSIVPGHGEIIQKGLYVPDIRVANGLQASFDIVNILKYYDKEM